MKKQEKRNMKKSEHYSLPLFEGSCISQGVYVPIMFLFLNLDVPKFFGTRRLFMCSFKIAMRGTYRRGGACFCNFGVAMRKKTSSRHHVCAFCACYEEEKFVAASLLCINCLKSTN